MLPRQSIEIRSRPGDRRKGRLLSHTWSLDCALGRTGIAAIKCEGDGATPLGSWRFIEVFYRSDRRRRPTTRLPVRALRQDDGWCDAVGDKNYNRRVRHPYPASAERLWRDDHLYDVVIVINHNRIPRVQGGGSAIFIHLARPGFKPTEGCVALRFRDMSRLLAVATRQTLIRIRG